MGDEILIFGFVILFVVLSTGTYLYVTHDSGEDVSDLEAPVAPPETEDSQTPEVPVNNSDVNDSEISDFDNITFLHWDHTPVTYTVINRTACEGQPIQNMEKAMNFVKNSSGSYLSFSEVESGGDVIFNCVNKDALLEGINESHIACKNVTISTRSFEFDGWEVLDPSQYHISTEEVNKSSGIDIVYEVCYVNKNSFSTNWTLLEEPRIVKNGNVIQSAEVTLFEASHGWADCSNFPAFAVHDLLHVSGLAHSNDTVFDSYYGWPRDGLQFFEDIMFPDTYCVYKSEIDEKYGDCLKHIYSDGAEGTCVGIRFQ